MVMTFMIGCKIRLHKNIFNVEYHFGIIGVVQGLLVSVVHPAPRSQVLDICSYWTSL